MPPASPASAKPSPAPAIGKGVKDAMENKYMKKVWKILDLQYILYIEEINWKGGAKKCAFNEMP